MLLLLLLRWLLLWYLQVLQVLVLFLLMQRLCVKGEMLCLARILLRL